MIYSPNGRCFEKAEEIFSTKTDDDQTFMRTIYSLHADSPSPDGCWSVWVGRTGREFACGRFIVCVQSFQFFVARGKRGCVGKREKFPADYI